MGRELILEVIDVLREYSSEDKTDETEPMSKTDIWRQLVSQHYHINISEIGNRKDYHDPSYTMVSDAVNAIVAAEYQLPDEKKTVCYSGDGQYARYWYRHLLTPAETKFLIDSVLSSGILDERSARELAVKLQGLSGHLVSDMTAYAAIYGKVRSGAASTLKNLETIYNALRGRKLRFRLSVYGTDKKTHSLDKTYVVSPYRLVMSRGKYYLLAGFDGTDEVYFFRVDLMRDVHVTEEYARKPDDNTLVGKTFRYADFQLEHPYMMGGDIRNFLLSVDTDSLTQVFDSFGSSVKITGTREDGRKAEISVRATERALHYWLLQYGDIAEVLNPTPRLKELLRRSAERLYRLYGKE